MTDGNRTRHPVSLDALLSANRDSFDKLFRDQMAGGRAAGKAAPAAPPAAEKRAPAVTARKEPDAPATETMALPAPSPRPDADGPAAAPRARGHTGTVDAVDVSRLDIALASVRREMEAVHARLALSPPPADGPMGRAMVMDGRGSMISGRHGSYLAHMLETRKLHLAPGDVLLQSDPYASAGAAGRLSEWLVLVPVFRGPDLEGYVSMHGTMADVGGTGEGRGAADAPSIFAEGIRIPPVKIYERGVRNGAAMDVILANSRRPEANRIELAALVAACRAGEAGVIRLCERMGAERYHRTCAATLDRTRDAMRQVIVDAIPEEPQSFEDQIDDDGRGNGPFKLRLTVWREGEHAYFDWTGTSAQAPGPVNFYLHVGLAKMFVGDYLLRAAGHGAVCDDGYYDLIHVTLPKGSVLNPALPAAVGHGEHALTRQIEVLGSAAGRHDPAGLAAAGYGSVPMFRYSGADFRMEDPVFGGLAASAAGDGADGHALWPGAETIPAEDLEGTFPVVIESCGCVPDSGGPGRHRGGSGIEKVYRVLEPGRIAIQDDRHLSRPWGVQGGRPGTQSGKWIERADGTREALGAKTEGLAVMPGDRIVFRTAGGGGYGSPRERDPALVRADVLSGLVTAGAAAEQYGVVLTGPAHEIDRRATEELRSGLMRDRARAKTFDRGDRG